MTDNNYMNDLNRESSEGAADHAAPSTGDNIEVYVPEGYGQLYQQQSPEPEPPKKKGLPFWAGILIGAGSVFIIAMIAVLIIGINLFRQSSSAGQTSYEDKIQTILTYVDRFFLWDVDEEAIEEGIADGIMKSLNDQYAVYYTPKEYQELLESTSGRYAGIGVSIVMNDDLKVEVYKVFSKSPAEEAGIHVGDLIVEASGVTDFPTLEDLVAVVRGEPGTSVDIVIERDGERIPMSIVRNTISIDTVEYKMLDDNIGYIYIAEFDTVTVEQFNEALDDLTEQGMRAVIFDLRDNPGGDYDTVVAMCDRVLPEGVIMTVKDKNGTIKTENSDEAHKVDLPMAVIINGNSASASEVFTGAIQDYDIATIVGEPSFGKGIVQSIFSLYDGSGLKFTTQEYFTPSGDSINGVGIQPDIIVELPEDAYEDGVLTEEEDTQLKAAIDSLTVQ